MTDFDLNSSYHFSALDLGVVGSDSSPRGGLMMREGFGENRNADRSVLAEGGSGRLEGLKWAWSLPQLRVSLST